MKTTEPEVFLIGHTVCVPEGLGTLMESLGTEADTVTNASEEGNSQAAPVLETAGRLCYKSFDTDLNPNVNRTRKGQRNYLGNGIMKTGHGSVLEHASATLVFRNVSRVVTHELVRHRAGTAFSQESGRYVYPKELVFQEFENFWDPMFKRMRELCHELEKEMNRLEPLIAGQESFCRKKVLTSDMRKFLPEGRVTDIAITGNMRAWRHIINLRTSVHAEEQIRQICLMAYTTLADAFPELFQDASVNDNGEVKFEWSC